MSTVEPAPLFESGPPSRATNLDEREREELLWRRISDGVTENVDKQIKRRYFWAALIFAALSWFGGVALINVQLKVAEKMEPAQKAVAKAEVVAEQAAKTANEAQISARRLLQQLEDAQKTQTQLAASLQTVQLGTNAAIQQLQTAVAGGASAATQSEKPRLLIRFGSGISQELAHQIADQLRDLTASISYGSGSFVAQTSLRFFYEEDARSAEIIAQKAAGALQRAGITDKPVLVASLISLPLKPPKGTLELWVNRTDSRP